MKTMETILESSDHFRAALAVENQYRASVVALELQFWKELRAAIEDRLEETELTDSRWVDVRENRHYSEEFIHQARHLVTQQVFYGLNLPIKEIGDGVQIVLTIRVSHFVFYGFLAVADKHWVNGKWLTGGHLRTCDDWSVEETDDNLICFRYLTPAAASLLDAAERQRIVRTCAAHCIRKSQDLLEGLDSEERDKLLTEMGMP